MKLGIPRTLLARARPRDSDRLAFRPVGRGRTAQDGCEPVAAREGAHRHVGLRRYSRQRGGAAREGWPARVHHRHRWTLTHYHEAARSPFIKALPAGSTGTSTPKPSSTPTRTRPKTSGSRSSSRSSWRGINNADRHRRSVYRGLEAGEVAGGMPAGHRRAGQRAARMPRSRSDRTGSRTAVGRPPAHCSRPPTGLKRQAENTRLKRLKRHALQG